MLNSGKKICATKKINVLTLVLSGKKVLNETKKHKFPPPFKLNGRSLTISYVCVLYIVVCTFSFGHCGVCSSIYEF